MIARGLRQRWQKPRICQTTVI